MKRNKKLLTIGIAVAVITFIAASILLLTKPKTTVDSIKIEYESLNGETMKNGATYIEVSLPSNHVFKEKSEAEVLNLLDKGTGAIYFGFGECPWCRNSIGVLDQVAKDVNLSEITYVNVREIRDTKVLKGNEVVTTKEGTPFYKSLLEALGEDAPIYQAINDPSIKRIPAPFLVVVVDGVITDTHSGTVPTEDPLQPLTKEETKQLSDIYKEMFLKIPGCYLGTLDYCE